jgi:Rrf2 family protein
MKMSSAEEYGLRCLLQVAQRPGPEPVGISEIAAAEGLSPEYTAKLMRILRRGGLVISYRGAKGGYALSRDPAAITVWEAINVLDGPLIPDGHCEIHSGKLPSCVHGTECSLRVLLRWIAVDLERTLRTITLADLIHTEETILERLITGGLEVAAGGGK